MVPVRSQSGAGRASLLTLAAAALACGPSPQTPPPTPAAMTGCLSPSDCQPSACGSAACACVAGLCLPFAPWPAAFAIEVSPRGGQLPPVELTVPKLDATGVATFSVPTPVPIRATFKYAAISPPAIQANITLAVRPVIAGRPDIPFEALSASGGAVNWNLPAPLIGHPAFLTIAPRAPGDQTSPTHTFPLTLAAGTNAIDVSKDTFVSITGRVLSAAGDVVSASLVARAFVRGVVVSNSPTLTNGTFVLLVSAALAQSDAITVQVGPNSRTFSDPTFLFAPQLFLTNTDLGTIKLPAFVSPPQQFRLAVVGDDPMRPPVAGALVRAVAVLDPSDPAQATTGRAQFAAEGITDGGGLATLALIPGGQTFLHYRIVVVPPPGSSYGTTCFPDQPVGAGGALAAPFVLQPSRVLPRRPVFSGRILDGTSGSPVPGVRITATPGPDPVPSCSATPAGAATDVSRDGGAFSLPLDPGTYQLDFDPPGDAPVPRLTELDVAIGEDIDRDIVLPRGQVVEGVLQSVGTPVANATVRIFEPRCDPLSIDDCFGASRTPPSLRAQVQSGPDGHFRAVVPAPQPAAP